jgi:hypothetical protein
VRPTLAAAGWLALALAAMAACHPALFTLETPTITHLTATAPDGGPSLDDAASGDAGQPPTPPAPIYGDTQTCARLAALTCAIGLDPVACGAAAPQMDQGCVLAAATVDEVRRCRGVVCP